jgi:hypothetical protein
MSRNGRLSHLGHQLEPAGRSARSGAGSCDAEPLGEASEHPGRMQSACLHRHRGRRIERQPRPGWPTLAKLGHVTVPPPGAGRRSTRLKASDRAPIPAL